MRLLLVHLGGRPPGRIACLTGASSFCEMWHAGHTSHTGRPHHLSPFCETWHLRHTRHSGQPHHRVRFAKMLRARHGRPTAIELVMRNAAHDPAPPTTNERVVVMLAARHEAPKSKGSLAAAKIA